LNAVQIAALRRHQPLPGQSLFASVARAHGRL